MLQRIRAKLKGPNEEWMIVSPTFKNDDVHGKKLAEEYIIKHAKQHGFSKKELVKIEVVDDIYCPVY